MEPDASFYNVEHLITILKDEDTPQEYICPITQDFMRDPVIAEDGWPSSCVDDVPFSNFNALFLCCLMFRSHLRARGYLCMGEQAPYFSNHPRIHFFQTNGALPPPQKKIQTCFSCDIFLFVKQCNHRLPTLTCRT